MNKFVLFIISIYQHICSPLLHQLAGVSHACRYTPSCSEYAKNVIVQYGVAKGVVLAGKRILSCQPFARGVEHV